MLLCMLFHKQLAVSYHLVRSIAKLVAQVVFEGVPSHPDNGRLWRIVDKYKVSADLSRHEFITSSFSAAWHPLTTTYSPLKHRKLPRKLPNKVSSFVMLAGLSNLYRSDCHPCAYAFGG